MFNKKSQWLSWCSGLHVEGMVSFITTTFSPGYLFNSRYTTALSSTLSTFSTQTGNPCGGLGRTYLPRDRFDSGLSLLFFRIFFCPPSCCFSFSFSPQL